MTYYKAPPGAGRIILPRRALVKSGSVLPFFNVIINGFSNLVIFVVFMIFIFWVLFSVFVIFVIFQFFDFDLSMSIFRFRFFDFEFFDFDFFEKMCSEPSGFDIVAVTLPCAAV